LEAQDSLLRTPTQSYTAPIKAREVLAVYQFTYRALFLTNAQKSTKIQKYGSFTVKRTQKEKIPMKKITGPIAILKRRLRKRRRKKLREFFERGRKQLGITAKTR